MAEIVWESDAQSSGFTVMSNGMVWPDDWPGTLVEAQFTSARGDGADLDRDPDMVPSGPGRVIFTPQVRTVGYDGEHGKRIVSLHPFEAVVGDDGYLYTPDEYGQPGIRGIVLPSNNSDVVDEHDWTWRVTFDIPNTTIRPTHIPTPHDHSVDIKDYLDSDANYGVRVVVDTVAARETLTARDQTLAARDETLAHGITVDTSVGTRVYVGDTMIHGDTGWRDIGANLLDGWEPAANRVLIMREGNDVTLRLDTTRTSDASTFSNILDLPTGFNPAGRARIAPVFITSSKQGWFDNISGPLRVRDLPSALSEGDRITATVKWITADPWPSSLPGTPA